MEIHNFKLRQHQFEGVGFVDGVCFGTGDGSVVPAFGDFDRDGDLDVYILTHQIYRENGRASEPISIFDKGGALVVADEWQR